MKIISIQNKELQFDENGVCYHNGTSNYEENKEAYDRMFQEYNQQKGTDYKQLFWGFSKLYEPTYGGNSEYMNIEISRRVINAMHSKLGSPNTNDSLFSVYLMNIPDDLILETDFYNFTDYIYMTRGFDPEFKVGWDTVSSNGDGTKQVVFPYINQEWIIEKADMSDFLTSICKRLTYDELKEFLNCGKPDIDSGDIIKIPVEGGEEKDTMVLVVTNDEVHVTVIPDEPNPDNVPIVMKFKRVKEETK